MSIEVSDEECSFELENSDSEEFDSYAKTVFEPAIFIFDELRPDAPLSYEQTVFLKDTKHRPAKLFGAKLVKDKKGKAAVVLRNDKNKKIISKEDAVLGYIVQSDTDDLTSNDVKIKAAHKNYGKNAKKSAVYALVTEDRDLSVNENPDIHAMFFQKWSYRHFKALLEDTKSSKRESSHFVVKCWIFSQTLPLTGENVIPSGDWLKQGQSFHQMPPSENPFQHQQPQNLHSPPPFTQYEAFSTSSGSAVPLLDLSHQSNQPQYSQPQFSGAYSNPSPPQYPPQDIWETKVDPKGRTYYVNHTKKTTSWNPPNF